MVRKGNVRVVLASVLGTLTAVVSAVAVTVGVTVGEDGSGVLGAETHHVRGVEWQESTISYCLPWAMCND